VTTLPAAGESIMLDTTKVRQESDAAPVPEAGPRSAIPLGYLLAERLPQGTMSQTETNSMTGPPDAQDRDPDTD
jgi:hypothetical protein